MAKKPLGLQKERSNRLEIPPDQAIDGAFLLFLVLVPVILLSILRLEYGWNGEEVDIERDPVLNRHHMEQDAPLGVKFAVLELWHAQLLRCEPAKIVQVSI